MIDLSQAAVLEKNKVHSDGAWLVLLEIQVKGLSDAIRIVRNTEQIEFPTGSGNIYQPFNFEIGDISETSKAELPSFTVQVSNVTRAVQAVVEQADYGGVGSTVYLRVVHSKYLAQPNPELEEVFTVQGVSCDKDWVSFTLGGDFPTLRRFPARRILKNFCPFKYGKIECGISAKKLITYPTCNRTLKQCRERGNSKRFGGEISIPSGGLYI